MWLLESSSPWTTLWINKELVSHRENVEGNFQDDTLALALHA